jgi:hypothetical protein
VSRLALLEPGVAAARRPRFDFNDEFDSSVFRERFDFFLARSIWSHASKAQIRAMLDGFVRDRSEGASSWRRSCRRAPSIPTTKATSGWGPVTGRMWWG